MLDFRVVRARRGTARQEGKGVCCFKKVFSFQSSVRITMITMVEGKMSFKKENILEF